MITLIIVDCQNDFITGTMSVKGAKDALKNIKEFISRHQFEIEKILFTVDWHPYNHMSFKKYGGQWPHHCIQFTPGACIEPKLLKLVQSLEIDYAVSKKGEIEEVEEYGAFSDIEYVSDNLGERYYLDITEVNANTEFVICGIAGDYCVKATYDNLKKYGINVTPFYEGIAFIGEPFKY